MYIYAQSIKADSLFHETTKAIGLQKVIYSEKDISTPYKKYTGKLLPSNTYTTNWSVKLDSVLHKKRIIFSLYLLSFIFALMCGDFENKIKIK